MTATSKRRGEIRKITDLPVAPVGTATLEVEIAGVAYQSPASVVGGSLFPLTACRLTMSQPVGHNAFTDDRGKVVSVVGSVVGVADADVPGGLCAGFTGGTDSIGVASSDDFFPSLGMFWIEGWFKTTQAAQQFTTLCEKSNAGFNTGSWSLLFNVDSNADGKIAFYHSEYGSPVVKSTTGGFNNGVRHHVFLMKIGQNFNLFVDGVRVGVGVDNTVINGTPNGFSVLFGNSVLASRAFVGHLDNWRIGRGVLPYSTSPFTVPLPPFPTS